MTTTCDHCEAVRDRQAQFARGGQPVTGAMPLPTKYFTSMDAPGMYDGDPGQCPCSCHTPWRLFTKTHL